MENLFTIFFSGIFGVFCGMMLLYTSIKFTARVTDKILALREKEASK